MQSRFGNLFLDSPPLTVSTQGYPSPHCSHSTGSRQVWTLYLLLPHHAFTLQALSSDSAYIIAALRKSTGKVLEVNSEGTAVRRSPENPPPDIFSPEQRKKMKEKTVYVVSKISGVAGCGFGVTVKGLDYCYQRGSSQPLQRFLCWLSQSLHNRRGIFRETEGNLQWVVWQAVMTN